MTSSKLTKEALIDEGEVIPTEDDEAETQAALASNSSSIANTYNSSTDDTESALTENSESINNTYNTTNNAEAEAEAAALAENSESINNTYNTTNNGEASKPPKKHLSMKVKLFPLRTTRQRLKQRWHLIAAASRIPTTAVLVTMSLHWLKTARASTTPTTPQITLRLKLKQQHWQRIVRASTTPTTAATTRLARNLVHLKIAAQSPMQPAQKTAAQSLPQLTPALAPHFLKTVKASTAPALATPPAPASAKP